MPKLVAYKVPPDALIVATVVLLLLHVPPTVALASTVESPIHTKLAPVIGDRGFTTTEVVT